MENNNVKEVEQRIKRYGIAMELPNWLLAVCSLC